MDDNNSRLILELLSVLLLTYPADIGIKLCFNLAYYSYFLVYKLKNFCIYVTKDDTHLPRLS